MIAFAPIWYGTHENLNRLGLIAEEEIALDEAAL